MNKTRGQDYPTTDGAANADGGGGGTSVMKKSIFLSSTTNSHSRYPYRVACPPVGVYNKPDHARHLCLFYCDELGSNHLIRRVK